MITTIPPLHPRHLLILAAILVFLVAIAAALATLLSQPAPTAETNQELSPPANGASEPGAVPLKPNAPTLTPGHLKLDVSWSMPDDVETAITGYEVQYKETSAADRTGTGDAPSTGWVTKAQSGAETGAAITELTKDTSYDVRVRGTNSQGDGPWSDDASGSPTELRIGFALDSATYAETDSEGSQAVQFHPLSGTIPQSGIDIEWRVGSGATATASGADDATCSAGDDFRSPASGVFRATQENSTLQLPICGDDVVESNETIEIEIAPKAGVYSGNATMTITIEDDDAPEGLELTPGGGSLAASWNAPEVQGTLAFYEVQYKETGAQDWPSDNIDVTGTSTTIGNLTGGVGYDARVRAVVIGFTGAWSAPQSGTPKFQIQSSNANLSGLKASGGASASGAFAALTLNPATFDKGATKYTALVANSVTHVKLTPTVEDTGKATVKVGKGASLTAVSSGSASSAIALDVGANAINVEVTARDATKKTYPVVVTRDRQGPTTLTLSVDDATPDEGDTATVTATLDNPAGANGFQALLTFAGSADMKGAVADGWEDYAASSSTIVIVEGSATAAVSLTITDDMVDEDDETIILDAILPDNVTVNGVTLTIGDNDTAGATLSESSLSVDEGTTNAYAVALNTRPTRDVTVTLSISDMDRAAVSGALTFTPDNWSAPQPVTIIGVAAGSATITHAAASADAKYDGSAVSIGSVAVTVTAIPKPTNLTATPQAYNGGPALLIGFDAAPDGLSVLTQVKKRSTSSWPAPSLPSGASIDTTGLSGATARRIVGLEEGTAYDARAHFVSGDPAAVVRGSSSGIVTATTWTTPGAPTGVIASADFGQIALTWSAPANKGGAGAAITGYDVQYKASAASDWSDFAHTGLTTDATIGNLNNGTTYDARVRAKNGIAPGSAWAMPQGGAESRTTPQSGDATLSALSLTNAADGSAIPFDESFAPDVHAYTATVTYAVDSVKVTPTVNHSGATVYVNGADVVSGTASAAIDLNYGDNAITARVTAENGDAQTYTITVARTIAVEFDRPQYNVTEGVKTHALVTITLSAPATAAIAGLAEDQRLIVKARSGSADHGEDWSGRQNIRVSLVEGVTSATFGIRIIDDESAEGSETITLALWVGDAAAEAGLVVGPNSTAIIEIEDDDQNQRSSRATSRSPSSSGGGDRSPSANQRSSSSTGTNNDNAACKKYTVTVLQGEAHFVSEFVYRTPGRRAQDLGLDSTDVNKSATVDSNKRVEFGIRVNGSVRWNGIANGNERWFEDHIDDDRNDAGLRVTTSVCGTPQVGPREV